MQTVKHAIISAAGLGSRLELNMPKCLVEIGGRRLIDYQLDLLTEIEDVRIVVGFMEEAVMDHVRAIRNDVVFVRNPDYRTTSNAYSVHLATDGLSDPFLSLDGDILFHPQSFKNFLAQCTGEQTIIAITPSKTEEAVFVTLDTDNETITGFSRAPRQPYEWANVAYLKDIRIAKSGHYIYQEIEPHLPLKAVEIDCFEIDTPEDLHQANSYFTTLGL